MPATRDGKTWRSQFYYEDWQGIRHKKNKRGFKTKAEAEEWERNFRQQQRKDLDSNFENFVEIYFTDMENRLRESTIKNKRYVFDLKATPYFKKKKMPFMNKLKSLIKNLKIQCVRLKEEVLQLRKEKKRLSDDVEFYKGKIKDMSDMTELLQEKADDLERVKRYAGAEQMDTIIRKAKEQERTEQEQQIRRYDRSYGTR